MRWEETGAPPGEPDGCWEEAGAAAETPRRSRGGEEWRPRGAGEGKRGDPEARERRGDPEARERGRGETPRRGGGGEGRPRGAREECGGERGEGKGRSSGGRRLLAALRTLSCLRGDGLAPLPGGTWVSTPGAFWSSGGCSRAEFSGRVRPSGAPNPSLTD